MQSSIQINDSNLSMVYNSLKITATVLQLPEGIGFEALQCQPSRNFGRITTV